VKLFVYPSSCSVYGKYEEGMLTESSPINPINEYARCKAMCEELLLRNGNNDFNVTILRFATVCGWSQRQRLDLTVNQFANQAFFLRNIKVSDPERIRPTVHIDDLVRLYINMLSYPLEQIKGQIFNVAYENRSVLETCERVARIIGDDVRIACQTEAGADKRSYAVSTDKIRSVIGFTNQNSVEQAVRTLKAAFESRQLNNTFLEKKFYNKYVQPMYL
jgi:nucleoside-diphosphate-sugar epimerase